LKFWKIFDILLKFFFRLTQFYLSKKIDGPQSELKNINNMNSFWESTGQGLRTAARLADAPSRDGFLRLDWNLLRYYVKTRHDSLEVC
jgi:hypothetical protein